MPYLTPTPYQPPTQLPPSTFLSIPTLQCMGLWQKASRYLLPQKLCPDDLHTTSSVLIPPPPLSGSTSPNLQLVENLMKPKLDAGSGLPWTTPTTHPYVSLPPFSTPTPASSQPYCTQSGCPPKMLTSLSLEAPQPLSLPSPNTFPNGKTRTG